MKGGEIMPIFDFTVLNWNIGGAKYLEAEKDKRLGIQETINKDLGKLVRMHNTPPHVITLQEIVRWKEPDDEKINDILDCPEGYRYYPIPLIDSDSLSAQEKWNKVKTLRKKVGDKVVEIVNWHPDAYFEQGNAILLRKDVPHFPIKDLSKSSNHKPNQERHYIEQIPLHPGLYFGDRDTEPRDALVAHFIYNPDDLDGKTGKPLDVFIVNVHLTTLTMEREGIPEIDTEATRIRLKQIDTIFHNVISLYNRWKRQGFLERGEQREKWEDSETSERYEPVWIVSGDFNFTPESMEYENVKRKNFEDVIPQKGSGTKAKGVNENATLTLDYIFAGPKFISLDPLITEAGIKSNSVFHNTTGSDHYPMYARIPITIP